ncbi:MAG: DUF4340 domain-containing protein [Bacteroidota bacterium]
MKKSTWILLALLLVLAAVAYFTQGEKENYMDGDQLAIANTSQIHKIFIADRHKSRITLTKGDDGWTVNDKFRARDAAVNTLLNTVEGVRVQNYVAKAAEKNVLQELRDFGIKAEFYDKNDKILKVYYVGGGAPNQNGSYMMQEGDNNIYVVRIRNWEGVLKPRFLLDEIDWRDRAVFRFNPDEIKEVTVEYPGSPESSFKLEKKAKDDYQVYPLKVEQSFVKDRPDVVKGKVLYYLKGYEKQIAEAFENGNEARDSIIQTQPFARINVVDENNNSKNVKLFPIQGKEVGTLPDGTIKRAPVERYFASVDENTDFMMVQHLLFKRLLAPYEFFFTEEDQKE